MIAPPVEAVTSAAPEAAADDEDVILSVHGVSKHYQLWSSPSVRLRYSMLSQAHRTVRQVLPKNSAPLRFLQRRRERLYRDFTALQELSFEVRRGESLGIIGRNGSGKSTLLQIIAGTLRPSTGRVDVYGRVAALLELGSGFNPEFTGRENVYLNASILGLSHEETDARFDDIVAFADIGQFLEQPVKTYSSGMMLRLAFAVSINVEPDLLIIDEALAVGDVFFTQKCFQRLREITDAGTTLLFVSHSMAAVQNLCQRALLLKEGEAIFEGPPEEAASRYYAVCAGGTRDAAAAGSVSRFAENSDRETAAANFLKQEVLAHDILPLARSRHGANGTRELEVAAAAFANEKGQYVPVATMLGTCQIHLLLRAHRPVAVPSAGIHLYDRMNNLVFAAGTRQLRVELPALAAGEELLLTLRLEMAVQPGEYTFSLGCSEPSQEGPNQGYIHDRHEGLGPVTVVYSEEQTYPFYGMARLPMEVKQWR